MFIQFLQKPMQEDSRTIKELIMAVLEKCKEALPELAVLSKRFEKLSAGQQQKIKKKDCMNPTFLVRLSECGENIRLILQHALSLQFEGREILKRLYNQYMQVIYDIRKYHEQAHNSHDMHVNSTQMKSNLLQELNEQARKRQQLQQKIEALMGENTRIVSEKDLIIKELQDKLQKIVDKSIDKQDLNISHISKISKRGNVVSGQFYGGEERVGQLEEDYEYSVETRRLRKRILELEDLLQQKQKLHRQELQSQRMQILELEGKFQELMKTNSFQSQANLKLNTFTSHPQRSGINSSDSTHEDIFRVLLTQAATIEEFLIEQEDD